MSTIGGSTLPKAEHDHAGIVFDASCVFGRALDGDPSPYDVDRLVRFRAAIRDRDDKGVATALKRYFKRRGLDSRQLTCAIFVDVAPETYLELGATRFTELLFLLRSVHEDLLDRAMAAST